MRVELSIAWFERFFEPSIVAEASAMFERRRDVLLVETEDPRWRPLLLRHQRKPKGPGGPAAAVAHGAAGLARAITGTGGAPTERVERRAAVCVKCPEAVVSLGLLRRCRICGCSTWAKIRNADEACPLGKW